MSRQQRRKKKKDSGGDDMNSAPGWMTTYGDMMSLLLVFFILIVSFSSVQESEFQKAMGSLQRALGLLKSNVALITPSTQSIYIPPRAEVRQVINEILRTMKDIPELENSISFESGEDGVRVRISNPLLFDTGKANLKPQILPVLDKIATLLDTAEFEVIIEGHTDNVPIYNEQFHSNWELSAARSVAVVEQFVDFGINPERFSAVAYGEYKPLKSNLTSDGRSKNRRVEVFIPYEQNSNNEGMRESVRNEKNG